MNHRLNRAMFVAFDSFNWYRSRNYHCYVCGRNHFFISPRSRGYWVTRKLKPCKNGHLRTFSPAQWEVIHRLAEQAKPWRRHAT